jgi:hypothetical protein
MYYCLARQGMLIVVVSAHDVSQIEKLVRVQLICIRLLLPQHKVVLVVAGYVAISFVVMEILYLGVWCRPFTEYWAVPPKTTQCSAATNHLITNAVLNISSDLMIIAIPFPLLFKVKLPKKNKAILLGVFLIGTFTVSWPRGAQVYLIISHLLIWTRLLQQS